MQYFASLTDSELESVCGGYDHRHHGMQFILDNESFGGRTHAHNPHSSAFGAFQMIAANRKRYMGRHWQSTSWKWQLKGALGYLHDRYHGSWAAAEHFWKTHLDRHGHHWW